MFGYQETDRCIHPLSKYDISEDVFRRTFFKHIDYVKKNANGYEFLLHVGFSRERPSISLYLAVMDSSKLVGVETGLYHIDTDVLELCATKTQPEYRSRGLAKIRMIELTKIVEAIGHNPKKLMIKGMISKAGKSNAIKCGFEEVRDGEFEMDYPIFLENIMPQKSLLNQSV
jgi:hypothetical protein